MTTLSLTKYHGIGNDFLVLLDLDGRHPVDAVLARAVCDRHRGVGADGIIRATRPTSVAPGPEEGVLTFELRNADGSEAEMSGNGMRCLAHAAFDAGLVRAGETFAVLSPVGPKAVIVRPTESPGTVWASVGMGRGAVTGEPEPGRLRVNVGNPHLVILTADAAAVAVTEQGPAIERAEGRGINVEWVTAGPGPGAATMRVWERGVGETLACGTGSCAVAVALRHWDLAGPRLVVHQLGGAVEVVIDDDGAIALAGSSQRVGTIEVRPEELSP